MIKIDPPIKGLHANKQGRHWIARVDFLATINYNKLLVLVNRSISYYFVIVYIVIAAKTSEYFEVRNGHVDIEFWWLVLFYCQQLLIVRWLYDVHKLSRGPYEWIELVNVELMRIHGDFMLTTMLHLANTSIGT